MADKNIEPLFLIPQCSSATIVWAKKNDTRISIILFGFNIITCKLQVPECVWCTCAVIFIELILRSSQRCIIILGAIFTLLIDEVLRVFFYQTICIYLLTCLVYF